VSLGRKSFHATRLVSSNDGIDNLGTQSKAMLEVQNEMKKYISKDLWSSINME